MVAVGVAVGVVVAVVVAVAVVVGVAVGVAVGVVVGVVVGVAVGVAVGVGVNSTLSAPARDAPSEAVERCTRCGKPIAGLDLYKLLCGPCDDFVMTLAEDARRDRVLDDEEEEQDEW